MTIVADARMSEVVGSELEALDAWESNYSTPARKAKRASLESELQQAAYREVAEAQAAARASSRYADELEAAYQAAFAAMSTLVTAIEACKSSAARSAPGRWATSSASRQSARAMARARDARHGATDAERAASGRHAEPLVTRSTPVSSRPEPGSTSVLKMRLVD
jgi:hypothetical protein